MQANQDLIVFATDLAREAGQIITEYFYHSDRSDVQSKSNNTPVTEADKRINQMVIDKLQAAYPEHGVLGEEQSYEAGRRELWVCDPIDGTKAMMQGLPMAGFSIAYVVDGIPQAAVLFDPFQNMMVTAVRGEGAFCNGEPVRVTDRATLEGAVIAGPGGYKQIKERQAVFDWLLEQKAAVVPTAGCTFRMILIARGLMDGSIFPGRGAHDMAAAALIIAEAGGKVTDLDGHEQRYDQPIRGAVASNGHIHDELVKAVTELGSEQFLGY